MDKTYVRYPERSDYKENEIWSHHIGGEELPTRQEEKKP